MLTTEQILDAAEDVLRRFGPRKTTVVDVARALGVSHGTVYRHFDTKAALHEAITTRWFERVTSPLATIAQKPSSPSERLREWFETLMAIKQHKADDDPELFASYLLLAKNTSQKIVLAHVEIMIQQVEQILSDGCADGSFEIDNCPATARSLFFATFRFHHPLHANEWGDAHLKEDFDHLFTLLERAIQKGIAYPAD
ncbi:TetR family transcriptional regulator [Microbulbifer spongiae]|uniref:TetR family transcriptional regulator n=1 Tax=Microbulbifer spongiae TaxID=2944933 RepID=A0ABY9ECQ0_9GAMM|nr:TetR family transcriptional regulator [Microbulbifer sp. MI-G]WKD50141.1 TetR family transcriptional regulator [Microbulbifer sp. MI-G]